MIASGFCWRSSYWTLGQAVSIAYGRAVCNLTPRYLDLFAIGILVNFACLISIAQDHIGKRHGWTIAGVSRLDNHSYNFWAVRRQTHSSSICRKT